MGGDTVNHPLTPVNQARKRLVRVFVSSPFSGMQIARDEVPPICPAGSEDCRPWFIGLLRER